MNLSRQIGSRLANPIVSVLSVLALVLGWQLWVSLQDLNQILMPTPAQVMTELGARTGTYLSALGSTALTGLSGLVLGTVLGSALAVFCWLSRLANGLVSVGVLVVRSVPVIILIPVLTSVLGFDVRTTIAIVTLISFFPAFVLVSTGLHELPPSTADLTHVLGASRRRRLVDLALPAAAPKVAAAVRMSAGNAVLAAMVTEFLTGSAGLGNVFLLARADLSSERAWAAAIVGAVAAVLLFGAASRLEQRIEHRMS